MPTENVVLQYLLQGDANGLISALENAATGLRASGKKLVDIQRSLNKSLNDEILSSQRALNKKLADLNADRIKELDKLKSAQQKLLLKTDKGIQSGKLSAADLRNDPTFGSFIQGSVAKTVPTAEIRKRVRAAINDAFKLERGQVDARFNPLITKTKEDIRDFAAAVPGLRAQASRLFSQVLGKDGFLKGFPEENRKTAVALKAAGIKAIDAYVEGLKESIQRARSNVSGLKEQLARINKSLTQFDNASSLTDAERKRQLRLQFRQGVVSGALSGEQDNLFKQTDLQKQISLQREFLTNAERQQRLQEKNADLATRLRTTGAVTAGGQTFNNPGVLDKSQLAGKTALQLQRDLQKNDATRLLVSQKLIGLQRQERDIHGQIGLATGVNKRSLEQQRAVLQQQIANLGDIRRAHTLNRSVLRDTIKELQPPDTGNSFFGQILKFAAGGAIITGLRAIAREVREVITGVIETSAEFQRLETSFVSILADNVIEREGKLTPESIAALRVESSKLFKESQIAAVQTVATTKEYVQLLQTSLAVGRNVGLTQEQIGVLTKRFALAAGAFGIDFEKVSTSIAQIFTGSVRSTNQLGRNLGLATDEQRKALRVAIKQGDLFGFLEKKTRGFGEAAKEVENNFINVVAAIKDIFQLGGAEAFAPLFNFLNKQLIDLRNRFFTGNEIQPFRGELQSIIQAVQGVLFGILPNLRTLFSSFGKLLQTFFERFTSASGISAINGVLRLMIGVLNALNTLLGSSLVGSATRFLIILRLVFSAQIIGFVINMITRFRDLYAGIQLVTAATNRLAAAQQLLGSGTGTAGTVAGFAKLGGVIGIIIAAITVLTSLYFAFSDSADDAAASQEEFTDRLDKANKSFNEFAQGFDPLKTLNDFTGLASIEKKTADQIDEFNKLRLQMVATYGEGATKALEFGKVTSEVQEQIRAQINESSRKLSEFSTVVDAFFNAKPVQIGSGDNATVITGNNLLEKRLDILEKLKNGNLQAALANRAFVDPDAVRRATDLNDALSGTNDELKQIVEILNKNDFKTTIEELLGDPEKAKKAAAALEGIKGQLEQLALINNFAGQSFREQGASLANETLTISRLRREIAGLTDGTDEYRAKKDELNTAVKTAQTFTLEYSKSIQFQAFVQGKSTSAVIKETIALIDNDVQKKKSALTTLQLAAATAKAAAETEQATAATLHGAEAIEHNTKAQALLQDFLENTKEFARIKEELKTLEQERLDLITRQQKPFTPSGDKAKKGDSFGRDVLSDFLREQDRQLQLIRKLGDRMEKEVDRVVDARFKLVRDLLQAGRIAPQEAFTVQTEVITKQLQLELKTLDQERALLEKQKTAAEKIAELQQTIDDRKNEQKKSKAKGAFGDDIRNRKTQVTEDFETKLAELEIQRIEKIRKAQDQAREIGKDIADFEIKELQRIKELGAERRQLERDTFTADLAFREQFGQVSSIEALEQRFDSQIKARQDRIEQLKQKLDPETDPLFKDIIRKARQAEEEIFGPVTGGRVQRFDAFQRFNELLKKRQALIASLDELNRAAKGGVRQDEEDQRRLLSEQLKTINQDFENLAVNLNVSVDELAKLGSFQEQLLQLGVSYTEQLALQLEIDKEEAGLKNDQHDKLIQRVALVFKQFEVSRQIVDFEQQNLSILSQQVASRKELGILTETQARLQEQQILRERVANLQKRRAGLFVELAFSPKGENPLDNPELTQKILNLGSAINDTTVEIDELKLSLFALTSPARAASEGLRVIAEALGQTEQRTRFLKDIFIGIADLIDDLTRSGAKKETAPEKLISAGETFKKATQDAAKVIVDAAIIFKKIVSGEIAGPPVSGGSSAQTKPQLKVLAEVFRIGAGVIAQTLSTLLGNGNLGQKISGIGGAARGLSGLSGVFGGTAGKVFGALGPIGAVAEVVGGFISFFGERAKAKTQALGDTIQSGINDLKQKIANSSITLGEGLKQLQLKLEDARRQLSGKKGGKETLAKIEADVKAEQERLREQAKAIQKSFLEGLEILRQPKELRDTIAAIKDIKDKVTEFLNSFENPQDALNGLAQAQEFVKRSIAELADDVQKSLTGLQKNLADETSKFNQQRQDILQRGRIAPVVSEAEGKRRELVALDKEFRERRKELIEQINGEKKKLEFVNERKNLELEITKLVSGQAAALKDAANAFANAAGIVSGARSGSGFGGTSIGEINIRVDGSGLSGEEIGISLVKQLEARGAFGGSKLPQFNPVG